MKISVLDHGYVEFIEAWGQGRSGPVAKAYPKEAAEDSIGYEIGIIEAARQSTQGSFRGWSDDEKLLKFLHSNHHATPFEFAGMVLEIQAPIFVFREWQRHRTQSYNEMSARYAPLPELYYQPTKERLLQSGGANKQAQGLTQLDSGTADEFWHTLRKFYILAEAQYIHALSIGVPKELARLSMPVGHYSRMRASANLRNWLSFLTLRLAPNAQWEIRQYAEAVLAICQENFPRTTKLFVDSIGRAE